LGNLSLNADLHAGQRIEINAGGRLILQLRTLRAEGTGGTIDIQGGSDLTISDSSLSAADLIEIDASGDVYIDTTTLSSNSPAGAVHIHAGNALFLSDNILKAPQQIALGSDGKGLWLETVHLLGLSEPEAETITIETGGDLGIHTSTLSAIQSIILSAGANLTAEDSIFKALGTPGTIQLTSGGTTDLTGVTLDAAQDILFEGTDDTIFQNTSLSATDEIYINTLEGAVSQTGQSTISTKHLHTEANAGITLNTQVQEVVAKVHGPGDIVITEADAIVLLDLLTAAGSIEVTAGATITAILVESLADHDVILTAVTGDVLIDYVGTGKTAGQIFVEAGNGSIREVEEVDPIDADTGKDVRGYYGHLKALYAVGSASDPKLNLEFDLNFAEIEGQDFIVEIDGDIEINVDLQGIANVKATGTITVTHLTAQGESVTLDAGDDILIDYLELGSDGEVFLTAAGRILEVLDSDDPDEEVDLIANTANLFAGLDIGDETDVARNLETAIVALQAESATGSIFINESDDLDLTSIDAPGGGIKVSAGGGLTLLGNVTAATSTILEAGQTIATEPTATLNSISLEVRAVTGITLNTQVEEATLEVTGSGDLVISETDSVFFDAISAADGSISVTTGDTLTAADIVSHSDNESNDITLTTLAGDIDVKLVRAGSSGDVSLDSAGAITAAVIADELDAVAAADIILDTSVVGLTVATRGMGDITITETDDLFLTGIRAFDGTISVRAGGDITADTVESLSDTDSNDIILTTTASDIYANQINAGSLGDVILDSTGSITVTVVADDLFARAQGPMTLTTAVGRVDAETIAMGDLNITETDDIILLNVRTFDGSITVTAGGNIKATLVESMLDSDDNDITITTTDGAIEDDVINAGMEGDVTLSSAGVLKANIIADALVALAGGEMILNTTVTSLDAETTAAGDVIIDETDDIILTHVRTFDGSMISTYKQPEVIFMPHRSVPALKGM
jgi:hypothetical protein